MAAVFTQARTVAAGGRVSAGDLASLAQAINTRLISGVGDFHRRVGFYLFSGLFRKVRNDGGGLTTPEAEFFNAYQMLDPADAEWPLAAAGDEEGANLGNHINSFVHGSAAISLESERLRLSAIPVDIAGRDPEATALTAADMWAIGKAQRGAYDPSTGAYSSPMLGLAVAYGYIRGSITSPHGTSWGGYLPVAEDLGDCDSVGDYRPPDLQIFFTNLSTGEVVAYPGTCPSGTHPDADTHIAGISYTPFAYIVFMNSGRVDYYAKSEWIEGPYTGEARLTKTNANAISRAVAQFAAEFRGGEAQREAADGGQSHAFSLQEFLTEQYPLAPQIGSESGDYVAAIYPRFAVSGAAGEEVLAGELGCNLGGNAWHNGAGAATTHFLAQAVGLAANRATLTVYDGETRVAVVTLQPDPDGNASQIVRLARTFTGLRVEHSAFEFRDSTGIVLAEFTALLPYKPQLHDYYAVTRLASYTGGFNMDGSGLNEEQAKEIYTSLRDNGCIISINAAAAFAPAGSEPATNQNAVFDAARRLSQCIRILPRHQLAGYAVEAGKSVVWLRRHAFGMAHTVPIDLLEGVGPDRNAIASGGLRIGRTYEVSVAPIHYNSAQLNPGETFTANATAEFTGDGTVMEADGIREALPGDYSNGWCIDFGFLPYHNSDSSIWKPGSYADVVSPFIDRCTLDDPGITYDSGPLIHVGYGLAPLYWSETMTGFRYMPTPTSSAARDYANQGAGTSVEFMRSCRIYEPPVAVESAVADESFGPGVVKLTLAGRVHHHADAPASFSKNINTWSLSDLAARLAGYRTTEDSLIEYILHDQTGRNCSVAGAGDTAFEASIPTAADNPFGTCYPSMLLVKLIPEPYLDGNTTLQRTDSPALSDHLRLVELYLRAGCEGFVDGRTSAAMACDNGTTTLFDYSFENLCFDALGNRWPPLLPEEVRADNPYGHGPMPMTYFYAATFNALSACANRLTTARIMLPATLEFQLTTNDTAAEVTGEVRNAAGALAVNDTWSSSGDSNYAVWLHTGPRGGPTTTTVAPWFPGTSTAVAAQLELLTDGTTATLAHRTMSVRWRWSPDSSFANALPETIASLAEDSPGVLLQKSVTVSGMNRTTVPGSTAGTQCHTGSIDDAVWYDGAGASNVFTGTFEAPDVSCLSDMNGVVESGEAPAGDIGVSEDANSPLQWCSFNTVRTVGLTALATNTPAIKVPTIYYSGGD